MIESVYANDPFITELWRNPTIKKNPEYIDILLTLKEESIRLGQKHDWGSLTKMIAEIHEFSTKDGASRLKKGILLDTSRTLEQIIPRCRFFHVHEDITSRYFKNTNIGAIMTELTFVSNRNFRNFTQLTDDLKSKGQVVCDIFHLLMLVPYEPMFSLWGNFVAAGSRIEVRSGATLMTMAGSTEEGRTALKLVDIRDCFQRDQICHFAVRPA